ncbi:MAG: BtrH N-terminal domain-containing protein [Mycobacteriales bacterium]
MSRVLLDYPHRSAGHCGSGALRDLLDWAGLGWNGPPDEGLVFALGGGLGFSYLRVPGLVPPVYLAGRGGDLEVDLLTRVGASVELRQTDDPALGWQWVRGELDAGRPVMVWADIAELPYLRVRLRMSRHDIVLIGYDDDEAVAYVVDNDRAEVQAVPYDALARARHSTSFPVPNRHATFVVDWPVQLPDLAAAAGAALTASARSLTDGGGDLVDSSALSPGSLAGSGLAGIAAFAADVGSWPDVFDAAGLEAALRSLPVFIEKAGTGGGLFRALQAQGCRDIADLTGSAAIATAADGVGRCAQAWTALGLAAVDDGSLAERASRTARAAAVLPALEAAAADALEAAGRELLAT